MTSNTMTPLEIAKKHVAGIDANDKLNHRTMTYNVDETTLLTIELKELGGSYAYDCVLRQLPEGTVVRTTVCTDPYSIEDLTDAVKRACGARLALARNEEHDIAMAGCRIDKDSYYLEIAKAVALRSTCLKRNYGAVLVKNDEIIATGYNGSPRDDANCCDTFKKCPRLHVAHNSSDYTTCHSVHAEQNAIISAARKDMIGATLYLAGVENGAAFEDGKSRDIVLPMPCPICARMIRNAGILSVVSKGEDGPVSTGAARLDLGG